MLIFDPAAQERLNEEGVWREYKAGVRVQIRPCTSTDQRRFRKEAQKSGRFDQDLFDQLFWDHLIIDWDGIVGPEKRKLPLTPANKVAVFRSLLAMGNWACAESDKLTEEAATVEVGKLGNSGGLPAGKQTGPVVETSSSPATAAK